MTESFPYRSRVFALADVVWDADAIEKFGLRAFNSLSLVLFVTLFLQPPFSNLGISEERNGMAGERLHHRLFKAKWIRCLKRGCHRQWHSVCTAQSTQLSSRVKSASCKLPSLKGLLFLYTEGEAGSLQVFTQRRNLFQPIFPAGVTFSCSQSAV